MRLVRWCRLRLLYRLVPDVREPRDLTWETWRNLAALVEEFRPTFVLELGRGFGNSTALFTELSRFLGFAVVSLGFDSEHVWETLTAPRIKRFFGDDWFSRLGIVQADLTKLDLSALVVGEERVLLFWDAHGDDVAAAVVRLFPSLPSDNLVVVHDVYGATDTDHPGDLAFWHGPYASPFEEIACIWEYLSAHGITARTERYGLLSFAAEVSDRPA